ncbi:MAG: glycosyltransferase family 2 protein [Rhodospirillales bacterium]|nr:glycosyltransferase family 2 protein [Rhodospirillales bacterium]
MAEQNELAQILPGPGPQISVVVPVHNEAENIAPLVAEICSALAGGAEFEIIYVDDGSRDGSVDVLNELARQNTSLHVVCHAYKTGQSAAILTGVRAARAPVIATLDGDGQNNPADIPKLIERYRAEGGGKGPVMIAGHRVGRRDTWIKRVSSKIANAVRAAKLGDNTPDTGCGLKIFPRDAYLSFPAFNHMHRFLPALMIRAGGRVISEAVSHRPRQAGQSNYGTWDRLWVGIADLRGVAWLAKRPLNPEIISPGAADDAPGGV